MNEKDKAALEATIAQLMEGFKVELRAAVQPLVEEINESQQRSHNFVVAVNARMRLLNARIKLLEEELAATRKPAAAKPLERLSTEAWKAAHAALCAESRAGQTFFTPTMVRGKWAEMQGKAEPVMPATPVVEAEVDLDNLPF